MTRKHCNVLIAVDKASEVPLTLQIYRQVCDAIASGQLAAGDRLPPVRTLSTTVQVSHTTVENAYLKLSVEGYVRAVPRSGYVVERLDSEFLQTAQRIPHEELDRAKLRRAGDAFAAENRQGGRAAYDFSYANLQPGSFPVRTWRQLTNEVLYSNYVPDLARYGFVDEPNSFRRAMASYLNRTRGMHCTPEQVLPQPGTDGAIATALQLFDRNAHALAIEEPGYVTVREVAQRLGFTCQAIPSDQGPDAFLGALRRLHPKIVFTTPSHQFPSGSVLSLQARIELLKWAEETNAYIIEDDACNEYRYDIGPVPSLQSLDARNRVIYLCNFSKSLSPSMRVAYLALPPKLLGRYLELFSHSHPAVPWLEQEVLARFVESGAFEQHVRKMSLGNKKRHDLLLSRLEQQFPTGGVTVSGTNAGMHLYLAVHNGMSQEELLASARAHGAAVYGTKRFWFSRPAPEDRVMVGFSSIRDQDIAPGVAALRHAWFG